MTQEYLFLGIIHLLKFNIKIIRFLHFILIHNFQIEQRTFLGF